MKDAWNELFASDGFCTDLNPREFVTDSMADIPPCAGPVLDVGCGCGRHLVYLAAKGYDVFGIDTSPVAIKKARENLARFKLRATLEKSSMWNIPFDGVHFTCALAINVLNHGMPDEIAQSVEAVAHRLLPEGTLLLTLLTANDYRRCGEQKGPNTFICAKGPETGVLHTFFDESTAKELLRHRFLIHHFETASRTVALDTGEEVLSEFFRIRGRTKS